jgi:hemoglobin
MSRAGEAVSRDPPPSRLRFARYVNSMGDDPTLYEWAGGRHAFDAMVNAFYDRVEQDELLSPFFPGGVHAEHRRNVATWWCEVFGGQAEYTEELGGYERMLSKHKHLGITGAQRFRFASLMSLAADDAGMPGDPEFRSALVAYLEWGTRIALGNSQPDAKPAEHAPVPRWGWGEAPPYQP